VANVVVQAPGSPSKEAVAEFDSNCLFLLINPTNTLICFFKILTCMQAKIIALMSQPHVFEHIHPFVLKNL